MGDGEVKSKKVDWGSECESMIFSAHTTKGVAKIHYIIVVWCFAHSLPVVHTPFLLGDRVKMDFSMRDGKYEKQNENLFV